MPRLLLNCDRWKQTERRYLNTTATLVVVVGLSWGWNASKSLQIASPSATSHLSLSLVAAAVAKPRAWRVFTELHNRDLAWVWEPTIRGDILSFVMFVRFSVIIVELQGSHNDQHSLDNKTQPNASPEFRQTTPWVTLIAWRWNDFELIFSLFLRLIMLAFLSNDGELSRAIGSNYD